MGLGAVLENCVAEAYILTREIATALVAAHANGTTGETYDKPTD